MVNFPSEVNCEFRNRKLETWNNNITIATKKYEKTSIP